MKTLIIDTHLNDILIFLCVNGKLVDKREVINKKNNSELIFPTIIDLINNQVINEIIVVNGPGSFTSVRLGITIAKTLAYTLNIPIKTISSLKAMAISNNQYLVGIDDNNGCYLGQFDANFNNINEYIYLNYEEFNNIENHDAYNFNYTLNAEKVYNYLKDKASVNPHDVNPIYIKKIGVEIDKKSY